MDPKAKKQGDEVEGDETPATVAGMTDERFSQYARLSALKVAEQHGRVHAKMPFLILQDAQMFHDWVMTGEQPNPQPSRR